MPLSSPDPVDRPSATERTRARIHHGHRVRPFRAAPWLPGGHLQTLGGKFLRPVDDPGLRRERWDTPDGDFVDLDFGPDPGGDAPIVLVLHGLEGSTGRGYVRVLMAELLARGVLPVGLNFRSCSGELNRQARFYHSGDTADPAHVLARIAERFSGRPLGAAGFSLGGNVLLRLLGRAGAGTGADRLPESFGAAVAISVPFDLAAGTRVLEEDRMGRLYTWYFLRSLQGKARGKQAALRKVIDWERLQKARTLREFDDAATAPLHGFENAWDYYERASSEPWLRAIRTPTLLIHAQDDPFMPPRSAPHEAVQANPWLMGAFPARGGHVGFVEGVGPWAPGFWAETEAARYLADRLTERAKDLRTTS